MISARKFVGIVIVCVGALLGLTALIGFAVDKSGLLSAIQAPVFEPALQVLLVSHRVIFTISSFVLVFFILICSTLSFARDTKHFGFTILICAFLAGFASWPHGTPFMLIVMLGAHWIALSEMHAEINGGHGGGHGGAHKAAPAPAHHSADKAGGNANAATGAADAGAATADAAAAAADADSASPSSPRRRKGLRGAFRRLFH